MRYSLTVLKKGLLGLAVSIQLICLNPVKFKQFIAELWGFLFIIPQKILKDIFCVLNEKSLSACCCNYAAVSLTAFTQCFLMFQWIWQHMWPGFNGTERNIPVHSLWKPLLTSSPKYTPYLKHFFTNNNYLFLYVYSIV